MWNWSLILLEEVLTFDGKKKGKFSRLNMYAANKVNKPVNFSKLVNARPSGKFSTFIGEQLLSPRKNRREESGTKMSSPKDLLVQTLEDSASQVNQARVRDATQRLEEWRTHSGFFSTLQVPILDASIFPKSY